MDECSDVTQVGKPKRQNDPFRERTLFRLGNEKIPSSAPEHGWRFAFLSEGELLAIHTWERFPDEVEGGLSLDPILPRPMPMDSICIKQDGPLDFRSRVAVSLRRNLPQLATRVPVNSAFMANSGFGGYGQT